MTSSGISRPGMKPRILRSLGGRPVHSAVKAVWPRRAPDMWLGYCIFFISVITHPNSLMRTKSNVGHHFCETHTQSRRENRSFSRRIFYLIPRSADPETAMRHNSFNRGALEDRVFLDSLTFHQLCWKYLYVMTSVSTSVRYVCILIRSPYDKTSFRLQPRLGDSVMNGLVHTSAIDTLKGHLDSDNCYTIIGLRSCLCLAKHVSPSFCCNFNIIQSYVSS